MDQNQTTEDQVLDQFTNNDLQKAIDDITNNTNTDPVFSDPVAAPSSIPEGDTGELSEPVGPFPGPQLEAPVAPAAPEAPADLSAVAAMPLPEAPAVAPEAAPAPEPPMPDLSAPTPEAPTETSDPIPDFAVPSPELVSTPAPEFAPAPAPTIEQPVPELIPQPISTNEVKRAALRDLIPLLGKVHMDSAQKFKIYRNIFEQLKDYTVLEPAYQAAREIPDETERAEALLYLVESIDKM